MKRAGPQSAVDPEYVRMNRERSQAAAARNRTLQVRALRLWLSSGHTAAQRSIICTFLVPLACSSFATRCLSSQLRVDARRSSTLPRRWLPLGQRRA